MNVAEVMEKKLLTVEPGTTLEKAYVMMLEKRIRHILVTDKEGILLGILSDRDIKKFVSPFAGSSLETDRDKATMLLKVGAIMSKKVISTKSTESLKHCITQMLEKGINAIPVLDDENKAVGIVTSTDMLKVLVSKLS